MDRLQAMTAFREVARHGGFAAAARALTVSTATVSRLVSELEQDLGVRLFARSTRTIGLTEEGELLLARGVALMDELDALNAEIRDRQGDPCGHLRISSVVAFGQERIAPALSGFLDRYPRITVELDISNRKVDLVREHVDVAIRVGDSEGLEGSSLKARRIYAQKLIFVATPGYVAEFGAPESLAELSRHRVVKQVSGNWGRVNDLWQDGKRITHRLSEDFVVSSPNAARNVVMTGRAVALMGDFLVEDLMADGKLVRLLPGVETPDQPIFAVFVHRSHMPAKVRAFIDYIVEALGPRPDV